MVLINLLWLVLPAFTHCVLVRTPRGKVQGQVKLSYKGLPYVDFHGVPFAQAPIGKLRFAEPRPAKPWQGVLVANTSSSCAQLVPNPGAPDIQAGVEDCLQLNVFVPGTSVDLGGNLDVIVYFHAGGFTYGSREEYAGPKFLMDTQKVVLVVPNYRLGVFGFLTTQDGRVPGNMGMLDQVMALKWVRDNIASFGGNPKSVTIMGCSAGGSSVHYHFLSPLSKGLFHRGISHSFAALNVEALQHKSLSKLERVAKFVGCEPSKHLGKCLRALSVEVLLKAQATLNGGAQVPLFPLVPTPDPWNKAPFLPEHPYHLIKTGKVTNVPWLASFTSSEGLYPAAVYHRFPNYLSDLDKNWTEHAPQVLVYRDTAARGDVDEVSKKIRKEYFGDSKIESGCQVLVRHHADHLYTNKCPRGEGIVNMSCTFDFALPNALVKLFSDRLYTSDIDLAVRLHASNANSDVWVYNLDYHLERRQTFTEHYSGVTEDLGPGHGDDQMLIFSDIKEGPQMVLSRKDEKVKDFLLDTIVAFARNGTPNNSFWTPVSKDFEDATNFLRIRRDAEVEMTSERNLGNGDFWRSLPLKENQHLFT